VEESGSNSAKHENKNDSDSSAEENDITFGDDVTHDDEYNEVDRSHLCTGEGPPQFLVVDEKMPNKENLKMCSPGLAQVQGAA